MLRPAIFLGLLAFAVSAHAALTLTFDQNLSVVRDPSGTTTIWITGILDNSSVSTTNQATSAALSSVTVTGLTTTATVYSGLIGGFVNGKYSGKLFGLAILPTTPLATYDGKAKLQIKFAKLSPVTTPLLDFSFTVVGTPTTVPEPSGLLAVGIGFAALTRRRR